MKKFTLILLLLITISSFSQGNLQFNQVKLVSTQETVPTGKVWKVESASYNGGAPFANALTSYSYVLGGNRGFEGIMRFAVNGNNIVIASNFEHDSGGFSSVQNTVFPMWLPSGTTLAAGTNVRYLSVIEFNVLP